MKEKWEVKRLGEVCEVIAGQSPPGKFYNSHGEGLPFYQGKKDFGGKEILPPKVWTTQTTKIALKRDILISVRAPVGPVNFSSDRICIGRGLAAIRCSKELNCDFLYYQLLHLQPIIQGKAGAVFASINKSGIESLLMRVPPLSTQHRIVGILDEAFAGIATAKAHAEKNRENARAIFESELDGIFRRKGSGWVEKRISEIAQHSLGKMLDKAKNRGTPQKYLRNLNVRWFNFDLDDLLEMKFLPEEEERYLVKKGDVLICEGGYPGRAAVWEREEPIFFQKALHRVRFADQCLAPWLVYFLFHSCNSGSLSQYCGGVGIQHFTGQSLAKFILPIPPMKIVPELISHLDTLSSETRRLAAIYERKLEELEALKKSLLHQAFTGAL